MNSREQFETFFPVPKGLKWSQREGYAISDYSLITTDDADIYRMKWIAWEASRETLHIVLPPASEDEYYHSQISGADRYRDDAIKLLRAAGLKVRP